MYSDTPEVVLNTTDTTIITDSSLVAADTIWYNISPDALDDMINYSGTDSVVYDLEAGKTYIYTKGEITYQTYLLRADYIEFDWDDKTIKARQLTDSAGNKTSVAYFKEGEDEFEAENMSYNFGTKKGSIYYFRKQEGEGYITADTAKKADANSYFGKDLKYTTCELEHPHFYILANKAKVVPKKIAVTGPAHIVIADVPTPLFLHSEFFLSEGANIRNINSQYGNHYSQGFFSRGRGFILTERLYNLSYSDINHAFMGLHLQQI